MFSFVYVPERFGSLYRRGYDVLLHGQVIGELCAQTYLRSRLPGIRYFEFVLDLRDRLPDSERQQLLEALVAFRLDESDKGEPTSICWTDEGSITRCTMEWLTEGEGD